MIEGKVESGLGLARQLGHPTINLYKESENCGVFLVDSEEYGQGIAFVMPHLTEIHFLSPVRTPVVYLKCRILQKIEPPENGILDYFYKGLAHDKIRAL